MFIQFSPQRSDILLSYNIEGDTIQVTFGMQTETLDFSSSEDGVWEPDEETGLIDDLGVVREAKREGGELYVTLLNHHGKAGAYNLDERYPEPVEVTGQAMFSFPKQEPSNVEG